MVYWKIYLINKELLHRALRVIGCDREWFYSDEFFNLVVKTYGNIENHYVLIYYNEIDCSGQRWDYDYDWIENHCCIKFKGKIDYRRRLKLEKLKIHYESNIGMEKLYELVSVVFNRYSMKL